MAGLVNRSTKTPLPLRASNVWSEVRGFSARTTAMLTYYNDHRVEIEGFFILPLDYASHVVELEATVEGKYIFSDIRHMDGRLKNSKDSSQCDYKEQKAVFSLEERPDDTFCVSIGKLSPWIVIELQVTIISEIRSLLDTAGLMYGLPSVFTPRIVQNTPGEDNDIQKLKERAWFPAISSLSYSLQIQITIDAPCLLSGVHSDTYPVRVDASPKSNNATRLRITLPDNFQHCNDDFRLTMHLSNPYEPFVYIEEGRQIHSNEIADKNPISNLMNNPVLMLSYSPDFKSLQTEDCNSANEFIFMIDRSGSMNGIRINHAKEAVLLCLRSLPVTCHVNIISFGTYFQSLFKESQPYTENIVEDACQYVKKIRADMGGTSLLEPLEWLFSLPLSRKGSTKQIVLITDGHISLIDRVLDCLKRNSHKARIYAFGFGEDVCKPLLCEIANITHGRANFIPDTDRPHAEVVKKLKHSFSPAITNMKAAWILPDGYDVIYTPEHIPPVYEGDRVNIYAIIACKEDDDQDVDRRSQRTSACSIKEFWFEEDEFDTDLIGDDPSSRGMLSDAMHPSGSSDHALSDELNSERLHENGQGTHGDSHDEDYNDSEVFLTEEEVRQLSLSGSLKRRKKSSFERLQSWKVSKNPELIEYEHPLEGNIAGGQWKSAEHLAPRANSTSDHFSFDENLSASTGDIHQRYSSTSSCTNESYFSPGSRFLCHPGYPTRHSSVRSVEDRSPLQKSANEGFFGPDLNTNQQLSRPGSGFQYEKYPKSVIRSKEEDMELRELQKWYDANVTGQEVRKLKQAVFDGQINTHIIDDSNAQVIGTILEALVFDKRRRLIEFTLTQEDSVHCCWETPVKQGNTDKFVRRDSGLGHRSSSEPKSDFEDDCPVTISHNKTDTKEIGRSGQFSKSSSGYFEQERFLDGGYYNKRKDLHIQGDLKKFYHQPVQRDRSWSFERPKSSQDNLNKNRPRSAQPPDEDSRLLDIRLSKSSDKESSTFCGSEKDRKQSYGSEKSSKASSNKSAGVKEKSTFEKSGGSKSVFGSFIDGVKAIASKITERGPEMGNIIDNKLSSASPFKGMTLSKKKGDKSGSSFGPPVSDGKLKPSHSEEENKSKNEINRDHLSNSSVSMKSPKKKILPMTMKYARNRPVLERSRTISGSSMYDLGDGYEILGDNITLSQDEGLIYLSGQLGKKYFKRLIPFKLAFNRSEKDKGENNLTIHQLAAKSIIRDLEAQLDLENGIVNTGMEYVEKLISEVSRSSKVTSKYTSIVSIDESCTEEQVLFVRRYGNVKRKVLSPVSVGINGSKTISPPMYDIHRRDENTLHGLNNSRRITKTKLTLFTPKGSGQHSPTVPSQHTLLLQRRLYESSGYMSLIDLQHVEGFWSISPELAEFFLVPLTKLRKSCPFVDPCFKLQAQHKRSPGKDIVEEDKHDRLWATALSIKSLRQLWSRYDKEWLLVEEKASKWMSLQKLPVGFTMADIYLMAQQSLNILLANSRGFSCK